MRIDLQTWGSEGDIQPFVALADGLQKAGHEVTLVITSVENKDYASLAHSLGLRIRQVVFPSFDRERLGRAEARAMQTVNARGTGMAIMSGTSSPGSAWWRISGCPG